MSDRSELRAIDRRHFAEDPRAARPQPRTVKLTLTARLF